MSTCRVPSSRDSPTWAAEIARLDAELVRRGLARSRGEARDLVTAGLVRVGGRPARKPAQPVATDAELGVAGDVPRWVGRGAGKLLAALDAWRLEGLDVRGKRCIDVGASTGGFTQVLLAEGAGCVVAVDVGHGQLADVLVGDPRVDDRSGTTVRGLEAGDLGGPGEVVAVDLSFISLTVVMPELAGLASPGGDLVVLVKPQFEVGRSLLTRSGVVADPGDRAGAVLRVLDAVGAAGLNARGLMASPLRGTTGNAEYLLWARAEPSDTMAQDRVRATVRAVTADHTTGERR